MCASVEPSYVRLAPAPETRRPVGLNMDKNPSPTRCLTDAGPCFCAARRIVAKRSVPLTIFLKVTQNRRRLLAELRECSDQAESDGQGARAKRCGQCGPGQPRERQVHDLG